MTLQEMREAKNLTQSQVAAEIGVVPSLVTMWESGARKPYNHADRLAKLYNVTIETIFLATKTT